MKHERYAEGWTDVRSIFGHSNYMKIRYGGNYKRIPRIGGIMKVDAHNYTTDAKNLDIEICRAMWIVRYGDGWIDASELVDQDELTWEIGNRLFWGSLLEHDTQTDRYKCKS